MTNEEMKKKIKSIKEIEKTLGVDIETFYKAMLFGHDECKIEKDGNNYLAVYSPYIDWWDGRLATGKYQKLTKEKALKDIESALVMRGEEK